jgi:hypothetical protein
MRKRLLTPTPPGIRPSDEGWLDLDSAATVEVTSEAKEYPVESALVSGEMRGWRAADSGTQTIRLIFGEPQKLTRISLVFEETATARTQEFVLRWSADGGHSFREIVRQQFNFSPPNTTREIEEYNLQLSDVTVLELVIVPDISRGAACASLKSLHVSWPAAIFSQTSADQETKGKSRDSERAAGIALGLGSLADSLPQRELLSGDTNSLGVAGRLKHVVKMDMNWRGKCKEHNWGTSLSLSPTWTKP